MALSYLAPSMIVKSFLGKFTGVVADKGKNVTAEDCRHCAAAAATALPAVTRSKHLPVRSLRLAIRGVTRTERPKRLAPLNMRDRLLCGQTQKKVPP
jgi:hypothetical protein